MKLKSILLTALATLALTTETMAQNDLRYFSGINKQEIGLEYPIEIVLDDSGQSLKGFINYSSLNCNGELKYIGKTYDKRYFFKEELKTVNNCVTGGSVVLEFLNDDVAIFYWYYTDGKLGSATVLYKSHFNNNANDSCKKPIQLYSDGSGVFEVFTKMNDVLSIAFIFDTGASEVSITPDVALTLIRTGTIKKEDWLEGRIYKFADGSTAKSDRFTLRSIQIGDYIVNNVSVSISNSLEAPMLLGQNVLQQLGKITIDYEKNVLCVE
jgi:clan AA aspartic protease (TIGR02281 family)